MSNTSFSSWKYTWLLDIGAHSHVEFRKYFFQELNDNVDGVVYFLNKPNIKPKGIEIIMLKFFRFTDFLVDNFLYLPKL